MTHWLGNGRNGRGTNRVVPRCRAVRDLLKRHRAPPTPEALRQPAARASGESVLGRRYRAITRPSATQWRTAVRDTPPPDRRFNAIKLHKNTCWKMADRFASLWLGPLIFWIKKPKRISAWRAYHLCRIKPQRAFLCNMVAYFSVSVVFSLGANVSENLGCAPSKDRAIRLEIGFVAL